MLLDYKSKHVFFILGTKDFIKAFRRDRKFPLTENPFEFTIQRFNEIENIQKVVQSIIGHEAFEEISVDEYLLFHGYLNGALELIYNSDIK